MRVLYWECSAISSRAMYYTLGGTLRHFRFYGFEYNERITRFFRASARSDRAKGGRAIKRRRRENPAENDAEGLGGPFLARVYLCV